MPGAIAGIDLGIISKTGVQQLLKRPLTKNEYWEISEKTSSSAISLEPSIAADKVKFSAHSEIIDKWENWGRQMSNITSGAISLNNFKLKGYCLYAYEKSIKDSTLIIYSTTPDFEIQPLASGTRYYYCQAVFDLGLRSSISNVVKVTFQKDKSKIQLGG